MPTAAFAAPVLVFLSVSPFWLPSSSLSTGAPTFCSRAGAALLPSTSPPSQRPSVLFPRPAGPLLPPEDGSDAVLPLFPSTLVGLADNSVVGATADAPREDPQPIVEFRKRKRRISPGHWPEENAEIGK